MGRRRTTTADYAARVFRVQQAIEANLDGALDPASLARTAALSLHHFHRVFRGQMGETIMQHVRRLRLERAARTLRSTGSTSVPRLLDLALDAGYESHEAFTRAFVDRFGAPPSAFRGLSDAVRAATREPVLLSAPAVPVSVVTHASLRVAFMRHRGTYARVGETWQAMLAWAGRRGLLGSGAGLYGVCPDDPEVTDESFLRFDACVVVDAAFEADGEVGLAVIPGGTYAVGVHVGPYDRLHETYLDVIGRWFPSSGFELAVDPVVEHYLDDPSCTPPDELRTEVRVRVAD